MSLFRVGLANLAFPPTGEESVGLAVRAIEEAGAAEVGLVCFPECFVPGYRGMGHAIAPPDGAFLERAWDAIGAAAGRARVAVILGSERLVGAELRISALVFGADGGLMGHQDKVQLDPSEEGTYAAGTERRVFQVGEMRFGIAICHEGWRYPETVRWAARRGAQVVFHPHYHAAEPGSYRPKSFADPANSFHEKAALCRAAENGCYFATVNFASQGSPTTSAVVGPEGELLAYQPYGESGLLFAEVDLARATRRLALRWKPTEDVIV